MQFLIITTTPHKIWDNTIYAYGPYIKEMNLWLKHVDSVCILGPLTNEKPNEINLSYITDPQFVNIPPFHLIGLKNKFYTLYRLPGIVYKIYRAMQQADHIHIRQPGNMGLISSFLQILFPNKLKTAKFAGNADPESNQPWSYRLQKWIVSNPFLSRNMKVLVYGKWPNQTKNVLPFFTASYYQHEMLEIPAKNLAMPLHLIFVGNLRPEKRAFLAVQSAFELVQKGISLKMEVYGEGPERIPIEAFIHQHELHDIIFLKGNQNAEVIKKANQEAHFLIFPSRSEGWPKVVAEALVWKCLPITTPISVVPFMLGHGERGSLVAPNVDDIVKEIEFYLANPIIYKDKVNAGYLWAKEYTLERFEAEIVKLLPLKNA